MDQDPYAPFCVHGTLPLVRDDGAPGGIRFARIGDDPPSDCISDPEHLPDAEMTIRSFGSRVAMDGYRAALAEHGGNAFSTLPAPEQSNADPFLLIIRHDRARAPGTTLDEVVGLSGAAPPLADTWRRARAAKARDAETRDRRKALLAKWARFDDVVRSATGGWATDFGDAGIEFMTTESRSRYVLGGTPETPVLRWRRIAHGFGGDLQAEFDAGLKELGISSPEPGAYRMTLAALGAQDLASALATARRVDLLEDSLSDRGETRRRLSEIAADPAAARILARSLAGLPVLSTGRGEPGAQMSLRTGTTQTVTGTLLVRLVVHGLMQPAWAAAGKVSRENVQSWCPRIYIPTEAARLLAAGRVDEAATAVGSTRVPKTEPAPLHSGDLFEALAFLGRSLAEPDRERIAAALEEHLPRNGCTLADAAGRSRSYASWSPIVHGLMTGSLRPTADGRLAHTPTDAPLIAPAPWAGLR